MLSDREEALELVSQNGMALALVTAELQADVELVTAAIEQNGAALEFAAANLQADRSIVRLATSRSPAPLEFAAEAIRSDRDVMLEAVKRDPNMLRFAAGDLRSDPSFVDDCLAVAWWSFKHASAELRADRAYVLPAVRRDGRLVRFASDALKGDPNVAMASVRQYGLALECLPWALRSDYEIVLAAVNRNGLALQYASPELRDDLRIAIDAVMCDVKAFRYLSDRLRGDPECMAVATMGVSSMPPKNAQAPPPDVLKTDDGFVEYRRPRTHCWPVVLTSAHGGEERPEDMPRRRSGCCDGDFDLMELSTEVWNEFGKERISAPAMVMLHLHVSRLDVDQPRHKCFEDGEEGDPRALAAWDQYHAWIAEALEHCVKHFGFALLLDLHGQSHRRLFTELGYLVDMDELLLYDEVLDVSTRRTSLTALLDKEHPHASLRPGGLANMLRGPNSLAARLEHRGFRCVPSPSMPKPAEAIPLARARAAAPDGNVDFTSDCGNPPEHLKTVTFYWGGYTLRRYAAAETLSKDLDPIPVKAQESWAACVAGVRLQTSWIGVRHGILEKRCFGETLAWGVEKFLGDWMGWVIPEDTRG